MTKVERLFPARVIVIFACILLLAANSPLKLLGNQRLDSNSKSDPVTVNAFFDNTKLVIEISPAPGNAIYQNKLELKSVENNENLLNKINIPEPDDVLPSLEEEKEIPVYTTSKFLEIDKGLLEKYISIKLQACSIEDLFCYLPVNKKISLDIESKTVIIEPITEKNSYQEVSDDADIPNNLVSHLIKIAACFALGITVAFTPCTFPLLPILLNTISDPKKGTKEKLPVALSYVIGMGASYALIGLSFGFLSSNIQNLLQQSWCIYLFAIFLITFSLIVMGYISIGNYSSSLEIKKSNQYGNIPAFALGAVSVLIVSPCTTPVLASLLLASAQHTISPIYSSLWLLAFGIGSGLPLMIMAIFGVKVLPKSGKWLNITKHILGLSILAIAVWLVSRINDGVISTLLWGLFLISIFIIISTHNDTYKGKLCSFLKILVIALASFMLVTASTGNSIFPNSNLQIFQLVQSVEELQNQINMAKKNNQPVFLKAHAKWCVYCKELDRKFFNNPEKEEALKSKDFLYLKVDVTNSTALYSYLEKSWGVIGLPEIIILDRNGDEAFKLRSPSPEEVESAINQNYD